MKRITLIFICICAISIGYGSQHSNITYKDSVPQKADSLVAFAKTLIGTTYKWGGTSPSTGFDCSGFCRYVFTNNAVKVPRTSASYGNYGTQIEKYQVRKGDVILFRGTDPKSKTIGHIGIVISNPGDPIMFIQCSSSKRHYGVVITDYENSNYPNRFIKFMRVID
jgi:cell wall-associated NlpC family hydrolase